MIVSNDIGLLEITNCSDDDDSVEEEEPTNEVVYIDDSDQTGTDSEDEDHSNLNFE